MDVRREEALSLHSFMFEVEGNTNDSPSACSSCVPVSLLAP